jgi:antirestriction protein ArdC
MTQSHHGLKNPTPLPLYGDYDERYTNRVFAAYKQAHGFGDNVRLGDMPTQVMSDIIRRAQRLKAEEEQSR